MEFAQAGIVRLSCFIFVFIVIACIEWWRPYRRGNQYRPRRWLNHGLISVANTFLLRLLLPAGALGVAVIAERYGIGLFHWLAVPPLIAAVAGVLALDLIIYWQHRLFHRAPWLWRLHRVHHTDPIVDVTTAIRFHPAEIVLSMLIKMLFVSLLGVSWQAVLIFEVLLSAAALFNHGHFALAKRLEAPVRWLLVTPDMHRIHHSQVARETHSNFGFFLSAWDRLFRSYTARAQAGQAKITFGLPNMPENPSSVGFWALLRQPFGRG